jgi:large subunit ribosomal protein L19
VQNQVLGKLNQATFKKRPRFSVGDRVSVSVRLKEGDKERIQIYRGVVIQKAPKTGNHPGATFTVRKISSGVGVERVFPLHSPFIEKISVESSANVRRSRLFYLRNLSGKKARLKEAAAGFEDLVAPEASPTEAALSPEATPEATSNNDKAAKDSGAKAEEKKA